MKSVYVFFLLLATCWSAMGQYLYVTTDNVVLRDRPEKKYNVFAILHPHCRLEEDHLDVGYKNRKDVNDRFFQVSVNYKDENGRPHYTHGWVDKRYVTTHGSDSLCLLTEVPVSCSPKVFNMSQYPPPRYKGAELPPRIAKKTYRSGPRGGCYYINDNGKKVYVDKSKCK